MTNPSPSPSGELISEPVSGFINIMLDMWHIFISVFMPAIAAINRQINIKIDKGNAYNDDRCDDIREAEHQYDLEIQTFRRQDFCVCVIILSFP